MPPTKQPPARLLVWLVLGFLVPSANAATGPGLPTLVSTNLCADLLVLRLAAPEQILALSRQSRGVEDTELLAQARAHPDHRGSIEELLVLKPDLVLAYAGWSGRRHGNLLAREGTGILEVPYPVGWEEALAATRDLGARIGRARRAEQITQAADARMRALARQLSVTLTDRASADPTDSIPPPVRALYLRPNGGTAGADTYVDDLITRLGLENLASAQDIRGWGVLPLERLVLRPPDIFLLGYFSEPQSLQARGVARHPLWRRLLAEIPSIPLPGSAWGCGGLELLKPAELIAEGYRQIAR